VIVISLGSHNEIISAQSCCQALASCASVPRLRGGVGTWRRLNRAVQPQDKPLGIGTWRGLKDFSPTLALRRGPDRLLTPSAFDGIMATATGQTEVTAAAPMPTTELPTDETTGVTAVKPNVVVRKLGFTVLSNGGAAPIAEWVASTCQSFIPLLIVSRKR
jgi:hypothetical protein